MNIMKYRRWIDLVAISLVASGLSWPPAEAASGQHSGSQNPSTLTVQSEELRARAASAINERARNLGRTVSVTVADLDQRLRLEPCNDSPEAFIAGDGELHEHTTVGLRCAAPTRWTIYLRATVGSEQPVLVAKYPLSRGSAVRAEDFERVSKLVPGLGADYTSDPSRLALQRLRLPLAAGEALTLNKLESGSIVKRGQKVTLLARDGNVEIRVAAIALSDGRAADRIQVQNENSQQVVEAIVRDANLVEAGL
jgi:flagella basal body P-ring formation protein FlgA